METEASCRNIPGEAGDHVSSALLTSRSLDGNNHLAMQTEMLDICPFATVPGYAKGQTHPLQTLTHFSLPQAGLVPTEGMRDHRQHPPGCSALSYSTGCSEPRRRELTIRKVKEQLLNLLSSTPDSQLLPKKRSLARKGKTRNWA